MKQTKRIRSFLCVLAALSVWCPLYGDGLPGEYLLTQRWRDLLAGHSSLHNPAFLTDENYPTVRFAGSRILQGSFYLWELGYTQPVGLYHSLGATWVSQNGGDLSSGAFEGVTPASETGLSDQKHFLVLSYAVNPLNRLSVGANVNIAYETNFGKAKYGFGLDIGAAYRLLRHPLLGEHTAGVFFQNVIPPSVQGEDASSIATDVKLSWMGKFFERQIESGIDVDLKDLYAQSQDFLATGAKKKFEYDFNWRIGCWLLRSFKAYFQAGSKFWGLGGGINAPRFNNGRDLQIFYQYMNMTEGVTANSHSMYALVELGKHREEIFARKMARLASVLPNDLYNRACRLYHEGKYWDAYFIFGQILARFPDFFKNDWVEYYRGSCLEELDMRTVSRETYENMKRQYPRSDVIALSNLGIMRIDYRNDFTGGVKDQFNMLNVPKVSDSLKFHAFYLMAETFMKESDWVKANQFLALIPEDHPEYIFAQHSLSITNIMLDRVEPAMINLENCLQAKSTTPQQQEVVNRSALFLGYLFYEQNSLSKAVTALRMVPKTSYYYSEALLGLGWTALKARQWLDCINTGKELIAVSAKPEAMAEGSLLRAYGDFMQKNYEDAASILKSSLDLLTVYKSPSRDSLEARRRTYEQQRISYDFLAKEAQKVSLLDASATVLQIIDSLKVDQLSTHTDLKGFMKYSDEFKRRVFFARGIDAVRQDMEYAYAVIMKLVNKSETIQVQQKTMEKQEDIDAEILKLKEEMQKLEKQ
jgi:tetratricopeptide (TPR) repeat protein